MTSSQRGNDGMAELAPCATGIDFTDDSLVVQLDDGRILPVPLEWFPTLRDAKDEDRRKWTLIGSGVGIHWPTLDEDLSVHGLLAPSQAGRFRDAG